MLWRNAGMRVLFALLLILCGPSIAQEVEVDVELFLAVDVSRSMSAEELDIQRRGYADALMHPEILAAINNGMLGRIAVTYVEWAGDYAQREVVPWRLLANADDARSIAGQIAATQTEGLYRTSISSVLLHASTTFEGNGFNGLRRVIDVSGDGPNNDGLPVLVARDRIVAEGITINGLPVMAGVGDSIWHLSELDQYYSDCIIGGPGAFMLAVRGWENFADAIRRKLILEIAGQAPDAAPERVYRATSIDCLIGEKILKRMRRRDN